MKTDGNYYENFPFEAMNEVDFMRHLKLNITFGESFAKGYYMYTLHRRHTTALIPTSYHKDNYPTMSAREAICLGNYLVVSPVTRSPQELKQHFCSKFIDGVMVVYDSSPDQSPNLPKKLDISDRWYLE